MVALRKKGYDVRITLIMTLVMTLAANAALTGEDPLAQLAIAQNNKAQERIDNELRSRNGHTGEQFAWNLNWNLAVEIMPGVRLWKNDTWMEPTEKTLLMIASTMQEGPDGYKGFIGPYIHPDFAEKIWHDTHVGDAILIKHMLDFAIIVKENPELREKYGESADKFVDIAKKDLVEKWNSRGTLRIDGPFAAYEEWPLYCSPNDLKGEWHSEGKHNLFVLPFNKSLDMAACILRLYYLTGDESYKEMATKIHTRFKAAMQRHDGYYTWNYWEPVSEIDLLPPGVHQWNWPVAHWVDTPPNQGYQSGEVINILYAYHMGVVWTEDDMRRLIKTNLTAMWNGNKTTPQFRNSTSRLPGQTNDDISTTAGLWRGLAPFDATILELLGVITRTNDPIAMKELENARNDEGGFTRKYFPDAEVEDLPWVKDVKESAGHTFAVVIPSVVSADEQTNILHKAHGEASECEVLVRPAEGGELTLISKHPMGGGGFHRILWDGKIDGVRTPGEYVVIWRYRGGERSWPVTLQ